MLIGIDLGTSMIEAAAFSPDGESLAVASRRPTPRHLDHDRIEQDFEEILAAVGAVGPGGLRGGRRSNRDRDGLHRAERRTMAARRRRPPVRPSISWLDGRGNAFLRRWTDAGIFEAVFRRNGNAIFAGSHAPLMAALADSDPEALETAATASYLKDGILQRLTGVRVTEASDASLPLPRYAHAAL